MKSILLVYISLFSLLMPLSAQQLDARGVMDRTTAAVSRAGGIEAGFTVHTYSKGAPERVSTGLIHLKGDKFQVNAEGTKVWFDGHTQWAYLVSSDEVNVTEPTQEELQSINPYTLLSLYKQGYRIAFGKANTYSGKPAYEVVLKASDRNKDFQRIILYVSKDNFRPLCINISQKGGDNVVIHITSYKEGQVYNDSFFTFGKEAYPTAEVIDLR